MKNIILYFIFLIITTLSPELLAQNDLIDDVSWTFTAKIPPAHMQTQSLGLAGAAVGVTNHKLMIVGGTNFPDKMPWDGGKKNYYDDIFIYNEDTRGLKMLSTATPFKLPFNLAYGAVSSTPSGIVIAGGENENGLSNKVIVLNWKDEKLMLSYLPDLPKRLTNAALTTIGNMLYLAGGEVENATTDQFLVLDMNKQQEGWRKISPLPKPVSHTVLLSNAHDIYLIGGRKKNIGDTSTIYSEVYIFNIKNQDWTLKNKLPYPISAASGIIKGNSILVFSGDKGETFHKAESLIAAIDREKDPVKKEFLNQQKIELQASHPGFSKTVLRLNLSKGNWMKLKTAMPYGTVTTNAVLLNNEIILAGGEIRAGVRTPDIIVGELK